MRRARPRPRLLRRIALAVLALAALPTIPILLLRWWDPATRAFMLRARMEAADEPAFQLRYTWVDLDRISPHAAVAVIAAEDQQFPFHSGFDLESIRQAVRENAHRKRPRGASTLTQQVAKNLFLWSGPSYTRKGIEAWLTVLIELLWPKERILEVYLNIAEFGHGIYGVEAASQHFFRKPASRLTRYEAAALAAVLPSPRRFRADRPSPYVAERIQWILAQMQMLGGERYLQPLRGT